MSRIALALFSAITALAIPSPYLIAQSPPTMSTAGTFSGNVGVAFSLQLAAPSATNFTAQGLPPGLTLAADTGLISGIPEQSGSFPLILAASNATGTGTGSATISIGAAPGGLPSITIASATATARVGSAFAIDVTVSGAQTVSVTNLPPGLTWDGTLGRISGTPTAAVTPTIYFEPENQNDRLFHVKVRATNATGTTTAVLPLTVETNARLFSGPTSAEAQIGVPLSLTYRVRPSSPKPGNLQAVDFQNFNEQGTQLGAPDLSWLTIVPGAGTDEFRIEGTPTGAPRELNIAIGDGIGAYRLRLSILSAGPILRSAREVEGTVGQAFRVCFQTSE